MANYHSITVGLVIPLQLDRAKILLVLRRGARFRGRRLGRRWGRPRTRRSTPRTGVGRGGARGGQGPRRQGGDQAEGVRHRQTAEAAKQKTAEATEAAKHKTVEALEAAKHKAGEYAKESAIAGKDKTGSVIQWASEKLPPWVIFFFFCSYFFGIEMHIELYELYLVIDSLNDLRNL